MGADHDGQRGQILVMAAAVMAFLLVPLSIFVIDSALIEASYAQLGEMLQAAAEDGASSVDVSLYRQSNGQQVVLDQAGAQMAAESSIKASQMPELEDSSVTVEGNTVTASAHVRVDLFLLGAVLLDETRSASFAYGG
jgi:hypothetical protein